jgi:hypothetical protein
MMAQFEVVGPDGPRGALKQRALPAPGPFVALLQQPKSPFLCLPTSTT